MSKEKIRKIGSGGKRSNAGRKLKYGEKAGLIRRQIPLSKFPIVNAYINEQLAIWEAQAKDINSI